ncbi:MAG: RNA polymerase sigma factor [Planctomycetota bacterium]
MPGEADESGAGPKPGAAMRTDEQLVGDYRNGDDAALVELIERYRPELFHFLARFVNSKTTADDLFQETFLQVHLSADTFDVTKRFKPWLYTIAANKARDWLRRNKRHRAMPLDAAVDGQDGTPFVDLMEADFPMPDATADDAEVAELVRQVVGELPDHLREVLLLAYFQRLAYKEIAESLGVPLGTVKSRLHAAVGTFAQVWKARHATLGSGA